MVGMNPDLFTAGRLLVAGIWAFALVVSIRSKKPK